ncbi:hypothetical protein Ahy_A08g040119 [Arachis hypogaea]|uniref:Uncharacterized protein n=1 Tax=Arachis hypogaea TaxID=3818 RepID=A0A445BYL4_ARAHY|nr:hypothetical protein Ahy_A08g040119 [Arachis hypogaea]
MRRFSFDIICKFSFEIDTECFIPSFLESKLADSFDLASKLSVQRAMSPEEAEGSNRSGGQCSHGDDRTEEKGDGNDDDGVMRDIMEIGREQCRLRTKEIRDHFVSC